MLHDRQSSETLQKLYHFQKRVELVVFENLSMIIVHAVGRQRCFKFGG